MNLTEEQMQQYIEFNNMDITLISYPISITNNMPQTITTRFQDGRVFVVFIHYNTILENWFLDLYLQDINGDLQPQVLGLMIEWGLNLFAQYRYLNIGEFYVYSKNPNLYDAPTYNDLSVNFYYIWRHS